MEIRVARLAGFCSGVRRAVDLAMEASAERGLAVVTCGPLVHNPQVTDLLARRGVSSVDDASAIRGAHVLIRSHGLPPGEEARLREANPRVTDATCPKVRRVQEIVADHAARGFRVLIAGEPGHPEVRGLLGHAAGRGVVVTGAEEAARAAREAAGPVCVVAQTTQEIEWFDEIARAAREAAGENEVRAFDTICRATRERQEEAVRLAREVEQMVVIGGRESGNTRRLVQVIQAAGTPVLWIEDEAELDLRALAGLSRIGVTAGASTPAWVTERVVERLRRIDEGMTLSGRLTRFLRAAVVSSAFSSLAAGMLALAVAALLGARSPLPHALLVALYLFSMQALNRFVERDAARFRDDPARMDLFVRHGRAMRALAVLAAGLALLVAASLGRVVAVMTGIFLLLGTAYAVPVLPEPLGRRFGVRRLKDLVASKNILVAGAWTALTVAPPAVAADAPGWSVALLGLAVALAVGVRSIHLDLADAAADKLLGMDTVPTVLGERRARALRDRLWLALIVLLAVAGVSGLLDPVLALLALFLFAERQVVRRRGTAPPPRWRTELWFDLHLALGGAVVWLRQATG